MNNDVEWTAVTNSLGTLKPVDGGFTNAKRGIISLPDDKKLFIKIGVDPITNEWAKKEVSIYKALRKYGYNYLPELLSTNKDETGFALEILDSVNGWQWETPWSNERLTKTLEAMDALAEIPINIFESKIFGGDPDDINVNPWIMPDLDNEAKEILIDKLINIGINKLVSELETLRKEFSFASSDKRMVHYDVRRDNCAWHKELNEVKLIDWNWLHLGSREIDVNALLVNVYKSGLNPLMNFSSRLDRGALLWLCGYWLSSSIKPGESSMSDHVSLRSYQFDSAIAAYTLASQLESSI